MTNKEYAIKQLQELPADEDVVVIIFTKADADAAVEHELPTPLSASAWGEIVRQCDKAFPSSEMWDTFSSIVIQNSDHEEIN